MTSTFPRIISCFFCLGRWGLGSNIRLDHHHDDYYSRYLKADLDKDDIEIPVTMGSTLLNELNNSQTTVRDEYYLPFTYCEDQRYDISIASAPTLFSRLKSMYNAQYDSLYKFKVKDIIYYATRGMVFDADFKPLLLVSMNMQKRDEREILTKGHTVYINNCIYASDSPVEKYIKGAFLTSLMELGSDIYGTGTFFSGVWQDWINVISDHSNSIPKIVICSTRDFGKFIHYPKIPSIGAEDNINDLLANNVDILANVL